MRFVYTYLLYVSSDPFWYRPLKESGKVPAFAADGEVDLECWRGH
jgi:hypothetical protein